MRVAPSSDLWFPVLAPAPAAEVRLFCFPHAGGAALFFRPWAELLGAKVEVRGLELPGRGRRFVDRKLLHHVDAVVDAATSAIGPLLDRPFAFFGHSLGARIAFETTRRLETLGSRPDALFVSAMRAPSIPVEEPPFDGRTDAEIVGWLLELGGVPKAVLENKELLELVLPALRADLRVVDSFRPVSEQRVQVPIHAFAGETDVRYPPAKVEPWRAHTTSAFELSTYPGGHFYLNDSFDDVLRRVTLALGHARR
jgi:surfactin synthase thioesterase subunit